MADRMLAAVKRDEDQADVSLRPQTLAEFIGQAKIRSNLKVFIDAARSRREALDHVLFAGPPGLGQDHAGADRGARARREFPRDLRAGDCQGRRSRGPAHQSRGPRRSLHRRNPSAQSGGRGNSLSGDGGLSARPHHRRRPGGAIGPHRSVALHPDRRHDAHGPSHHAAPRTLRHSDQTGILRSAGA